MIRSYLEDCNTFDPEQVEVLATAFTSVCNALGIFAGDVHGRQVIAVRIVDLAKTGVIDAKALRDRVLAESRVAA
jgi:methyl coenzyme M reductase gamma subunit